MGFDVADSFGVVNAGSSWTIPSNVFNHRVIVISVNRWRGAASITLYKSLITSDIGMVFRLTSLNDLGNGNRLEMAWDLEVTKEGVVKVLAIGQNTGEPILRVMGLF